ncbi:hypothetical protein [Streptomyces sp. AC550_RSS872]|uniref:hypothetical protein n=1 Tax=Streptomyces sp. AC550_RSS872 TaxID=2823689 RepID=UPI001C269F1F|nr:hypothetical protein [Streptomyces sp. AC550_RSS872]
MNPSTDDEPSTDGEKRLARAVIGGLVLWVTAVVGLVMLLVLLITVAVFPGAIEIDGLASVFWALLLLAPCSAIAAAVTVPVRRLVRGSLAHSVPAARLTDAVFGWLSAFLVGVMLLEWTPGVRAHSVVPAVAVATAGLVMAPLAERAGRRNAGD